MSRDEKTYTNPEVFDPDRFLDPSVPPLPAFGFGRRYVTRISEHEIFHLIMYMQGVPRKPLRRVLTFHYRYVPSGNI
jgi:hypothetical protein